MYDKVHGENNERQPLISVEGLLEDEQGLSMGEL
jgi:hypothetical protein